jgi:putative hemolysin
MNVSLIIELAFLVLLMGCSAFFSSAETALMSLGSLQVHRLRRTHPQAADTLQALLASPRHVLSTVLIGNTIVNMAAAALGFVVAEQCFPSRGEAVAIPAMTVILLLFGEITPKRLALARGETLAVLYALPIKWLIVLLTPLRAVLEHFSRFLRAHLPAARRSLTEDEFLTVVDVGEKEGVLDSQEREMLDGIIQLSEKLASDVMTPRVDMVGLDLNDLPADCESVVRAAGFRHVPLYRDSLDHVEGFLDVPRYLLSEPPEIDAARLPPFFVPETVPLDSLLATFQKERRRVAIVADEYGGTAGLVTRGDILEEIVDEVDDQKEQPPMIQKVGVSRWQCHGDTSLETLNYELDLELEAEGADRIAGWAAAQAEHIPHTGEVIEAQGCRVTVQRVRRNRILLVLIERRAPLEPPA